jgi:hypothetical protein
LSQLATAAFVAPPAMSSMSSFEFRKVSFCDRRGKLEGAWRDCVTVGRLLGEAAS